MRKGKRLDAEGGGRPFRHEGKGEGEIDEQKDWEAWCMAKEE